MSSVSFEYYRDVYGGACAEGEFDDLIETAQDAVGELVGSSVPSGAEAAAARAVCLEVDYLAKMKKSASPDGRGAVKESLGDYSVTYGTAGGVMRACGVPVSPEAVLCLRHAGLFSRWV